jgi:hypothetical protein
MIQYLNIKEKNVEGDSLVFISYLIVRLPVYHIYAKIIRAACFEYMMLAFNLIEYWIPIVFSQMAYFITLLTVYVIYGFSALV